MKRIKYNIWDKEEKEMHYDVLTDLAEHDNFTDDVSCWSVALDANNEDEETRFIWLQYVGINDKKGNEIHEGDIVLYCGSYKGIITYRDDRCKFVLKIHNSREDFDLNNICFKYEVIGNIYQTPELLIKYN